MITDGEIAMKVTQLIGLGEEERKIYECLERNEAIDGDLQDAYIHHQLGLEMLINYQKEKNNG